MTQRTILAALRRSFALLAISLAFLACSDGSGNNNNNEEIEGNSLLLNFTSDYTTGELRWMDADSSSLSPGALPFDQDSKVFAGNGNIFVLSRPSYGNGMGSLACILPEKIGDIESMVQQPLGIATNPSHLTVIGNKGYIAFNFTNYLQVFDINTCALGDSINLPIESSEAWASATAASGNTLLVVLQRLEAYEALNPGLLVRINTDTKKVMDTIQLKLYNPQAIALNNGKLFVASLDYNDPAKGGIEVVDLSGGKSEILFTGTELGGNGVSSIALNGTTLYATVTEFDAETFSVVASVKPINLTTDEAGAKILGADEPTELLFDEKTGKLFIADRAYGKEALKIYNTASGSVTTVTSKGEAALPPYSLAIARW